MLVALVALRLAQGDVAAIRPLSLAQELVKTSLPSLAVAWGTLASSALTQAGNVAPKLVSKFISGSFLPLAGPHVAGVQADRPLPAFLPPFEARVVRGWCGRPERPTLRPLGSQP